MISGHPEKDRASGGGSPQGKRLPGPRFSVLSDNSLSIGFLIFRTLGTDQKPLTSTSSEKLLLDLSDKPFRTLSGHLRKAA
jgi:hypothetical protein